jgi:hypothetical protein
MTNFGINKGETMNKAITLTAAFLILLFAECKKKAVVDPKPNSSTTDSSSTSIDTAALLSHMGGIRKWKGYSKDSSASAIYTYTRYADFEVVSADNLFIQVKFDGSYLLLKTIDVDNKTMWFHRKLGGNALATYMDLMYYYEKDSMTYVKIETEGYPVTKRETYYLETWAGWSIGQYMSGIGGMRNWTGTYSYQSYVNGSFVTNSSPVNESFEVVQTGPQTVEARGNTLTFNSLDTAYGYISFGGGNGNGAQINLYYYYAKDSMYYQNYVLQCSHCANPATLLHTY